MSKLRKTLKEYLAVRRALGVKLYRVGLYLQHFVSFMEKERASVITTALAMTWAKQPQQAHPSYLAERLGIVRRFAQYCSAIDSRTEVPPQELLPYQCQRKQPYIYSDDEIEKLIKAARRLPSSKGLKPYTYSTLFGLLAVTGMRISEVIALNQQDVNFKEGVITIHQTKFGKSRLVPVHSSTQRALKHYLLHRDRIYSKPKTPSFFISDQGRRLVQTTVQRTFKRLSRQIGLRGPTDSHGPRIHDFRHRFAVQTLLRWYRSGRNVQQHMPKLSTYIGHVYVNDTYWYLSTTPELLQLAAKRLQC
jgi:integrase/recombinase XerD